MTLLLPNQSLKLLRIKRFNTVKGIGLIVISPQVSLMSSSKTSFDFLWLVSFTFNTDSRFKVNLEAFREWLKSTDCCLLTGCLTLRFGD